MKIRNRIIGFSLMALLVMGAMLTSTEAASPGRPAAWVQGWGPIVNYYNASKGKSSMDRRTKGMITLASTRDKRALTLLADRYATAEEPADYIRALTIFSAMKYMTGEDYAKSYDVWAGKHNKSRDNWLKYRVWEHQGQQLGQWDDAIATIKADKVDPWHRGAAIEAAGLCEGKGEEKLELIQYLMHEDNLPKLSKKDFPNALHYVGVCSLLVNSGVNRTNSAFTEAFEKLVVLFDEDKISRRVKLMMGRRLRSMYDDVDEVYVNSHGWRKVIYGEIERAKSSGDNRPEGERTGVKKKPAPTFAGIPASGDRFAYVIDKSDSMLQPVNVPELKPKKKKGPITGKSGRDKKKKKKKKKGYLPTEDDLEWDKVKNRFDLAREYLRISLERNLGLSKLKENKDRDFYFTIITFNENAEYLKSTNGLVKLTSSTVKKAMAELDAIKPTKTSKPGRKYGTLSKEEKGYTNMHGGLRRAFAARPKGIDLKESYVNSKLFTEGVDTIFLLSDGAPSYSDWPMQDAWEQDVRVGDPETGEPLPKQDNIVFHGPYHIGEFIADDVRRQNLLRTAELHCIGIGEADKGLIARLARENYGRTKFLGR